MTLKHRNVATFFGLFQETAESDGTWYFLQEYGVRGSLQDILGKVQVTWQVKKSFLHDIASGMSYIHKSTLKYHQMLTSSSCLVTGRMEVKVGNFGVERIRMNSKIAKNRLYTPDNESELQYYTLWSAPELLRTVLRESNLWDSNIVDISSALFIFRHGYTRTQCEGTRDVNNI